MKNIVLLIVCCCAVPAQAALLVYEPFDYTYNAPTGDPIQGKTPAVPGTQTWVQAGVANPPLQIRTASGNLAMPFVMQQAVGNSAAITGGAVGNGAAIRLGLGSTISAAGSSVYFSFPLRVDALTGSNSVIGGFFIGLNNSTGVQVSNPTAVAARVQARIDPTDANKYNIGIFRNVTATAGALSWSGPLNVGDTLFVVAAYDIVTGAGNDVARMWINPSSATFGAGVAPAATQTDNTLGGTDISIASVLLRQTVAPFLTLDELRVGTDWASVTPTRPIPEPGAFWVFMAVSALIFGRRLPFVKSLASSMVPSE